MPPVDETKPVRKWTSPLWQRAALFGVAYVFCAVAGNYLSPRGEFFTTFWLPAGLYLAALLMSDYREWPWLILAALIANFTFDIPDGTKPELICFFFFASTVQAVTGAWLMRRFVAERPTMASLKEFIGLVAFAAIISATLGCAITAGALMHLGLSKSFEQSWKILWGSNAMAVMVLTPFILSWFSSLNEIRRVFNSRGKIVEAVFLIACLSLSFWYLLIVDKGVMSPSKYMVIPLLLCAALRFGVQGATAAVLFMSLTLAFFTTQFFCGLAPAQIASGEYVFVMQMVFVMGVLIAVIPGIVLGERDRSLAELRASEERFKNLSAAAFEGIAISENGVLLDVNDQCVAMFGYQKREEMIGRKIIELVVPEMREAIAERIRAGPETIYGHQLLRKDGSAFFAEAQSKIIREGGRNLRMTALRDITERKLAEAEREEAVQREQQARVEYTFQLIASQEAERSRIAAELHDSLGQNLLIIKNRAQLALMKKKIDEDLHQHIEAISGLATQSIAEARNISHDLHPYQLDHLGLTHALAARIEQAAESSSIAFRHKLDNVDDIFSKDAAMNLYRIVQESLNNVLKHSRAKNCRLTLERDVHEVQLKIEDDGDGFQTGGNGKGMGLKNITERVRMLGGKLNLDSAPGTGTRIEITIPISAEAE